MSSELSILALSGLWVMVVIVLHVVMAMGQVGLPMLASPRDDMPKLEGTAGRMERAAMNGVIALALFAPAVFLLQIKGGFTGGTLFAAQVFLIARVAHTIIYVMGIPWLRTLIWLLGFLATAWLYLLAL